MRQVNNLSNKLARGVIETQANDFSKQKLRRASALCVRNPSRAALSHRSVKFDKSSAQAPTRSKHVPPPMRLKTAAIWPFTRYMRAREVPREMRCY